MPHSVPEMFYFVGEMSHISYEKEEIVVTIVQRIGEVCLRKCTSLPFHYLLLHWDDSYTCRRAFLAYPSFVRLAYPPKVSYSRTTYRKYR
jgi:hypothetical protein